MHQEKYLVHSYEFGLFPKSRTSNVRKNKFYFKKQHIEQTIDLKFYSLFE